MFLSIPDSVMNSHIKLRDVFLPLKLYGEVSNRSNISSTCFMHAIVLSR